MLEGIAWTGRLNPSSLSLFSFSELNKTLDTNERIQLKKGFHFPSTRTVNSVWLILGSQYSLCKNLIEQAPSSALRAETNSRYQSDPPENQNCHTDEGGTSLACYQSTLFSRTSFFSQWDFPSSGRSTNEILWEIVANSPFLSPSRFHRSPVRSCETCFALPNRRACLQARITSELKNTSRKTRRNKVAMNLGTPDRQCVYHETIRG